MKTKIKEAKAQIIRHQRIGADSFRLRLRCPEIARLAQPGQFIMLRISEQSDPFLRRPFSFSRVFPPGEKKKMTEEDGILEICYKVVGRGTSLMTRLKEGQQIHILGPLGNGFWAAEGRKQAILIGGGIGIAPLIPWAEKLRRGLGRNRASRNLNEQSAVIVIIGGESREKILGVKEFQKLDMEPLISTEDGSLGIPGMATDLLERELMTRGHASIALYACGPMPMLAKVAQIADQFDLPCQVLLEARMACGMGACLGCAVKVREEDSLKISQPPADAAEEKILFTSAFAGDAIGASSESFVPDVSQPPAFRYARACKEGPVFESREIIWE
ncbi:MAG: dihydroorotate dehydrogenase electron transfer subunit [Thermodesulfobacteriota bacterium]|nr:dihydroorotate dehydrogenase electron transfer subunit [Thermodesulfobacteriota bacterium]